MVVAIELSAFSLYEGQTLYRGRADVRVRVLDLKAGGGEVFSRRMAEITFPSNAAYPTTDSSENKFRVAFLQDPGRTRRPVVLSPRNLGFLRRRRPSII